MRDVAEIGTVEAVDVEREGLLHDVGSSVLERHHQVHSVVVQLVLVACLPRFVERVEHAREENIEGIEQYLNTRRYVLVSAFRNGWYGDRIREGDGGILEGELAIGPGLERGADIELGEAIVVRKFVG